MHSVHCDRDGVKATTFEAEDLTFEVKTKDLVSHCLR